MHSSSLFGTDPHGCTSLRWSSSAVGVLKFSYPKEKISSTYGATSEVLLPFRRWSIQKRQLVKETVEIARIFKKKWYRRIKLGGYYLGSLNGTSLWRPSKLHLSKPRRARAIPTFDCQCRHAYGDRHCRHEAGCLSKEALGEVIPSAWHNWGCDVVLSESSTLKVFDRKATILSGFQSKVAWLRHLSKQDSRPLNTLSLLR